MNKKLIELINEIENQLEFDKNTIIPIINKIRNEIEKYESEVDCKKCEYFTCFARDTPQCLITRIEKIQKQIKEKEIKNNEY